MASKVCQALVKGKHAGIVKLLLERGDGGGGGALGVTVGRYRLSIQNPC